MPYTGWLSDELTFADLWYQLGIIESVRLRGTPSSIEFWHLLKRMWR